MKTVLIANVKNHILSGYPVSLLISRFYFNPLPVRYLFMLLLSSADFVFKLTFSKNVL